MKRTIAKAAESGQIGRFCERWKIEELAVFGSVARGDDHESSDVDLLVKFAPAAAPGAAAEEAMRDELQRLFGRPVDLVREHLLTNPYRRHNVLLDKKRLFPVFELHRQRVRDGHHYDRDAGFLWDIVHAGRTLESLIAGKTLEVYESDEILRLACERVLIRLGEAARSISAGFRAEHPEVPWARIVAHRNLLVHNYGAVDHEIVWSIMTVEVPRLAEWGAGVLSRARPV